jgi:uncharacterized protein with von Willebrand factor type A (vWA) domain
MIKAEESHKATEQYLFDSKDPTSVYLRSALTKVDETRTLWHKAQPSGTSSSMQQCFAHRRCMYWREVLVWMAQQIDESILSDKDKMDQESTEHDFSWVPTFGGRLSKEFEEASTANSGKSSTMSNTEAGSSIIAS